MGTDPNGWAKTSAADATAERLAVAISISGLLHAVSNRMTASGTATYAPFGLGLLEARLLYVLAKNPPISASRLALRLAVDPAAVSRALTRLASRGHLAPRVDRQFGPALTREGFALAESIQAVFDERCLRLVEEISIEELQTAAALLARIEANLDRVAVLGDEVRGGDRHGQSAI